MNKHIYCICILKHCLVSIIGPHYPTEIVKLIIQMTYQTKISCGWYNSYLISEPSYVWGLQCGSDRYRKKIDLCNIETISCGADHMIALTHQNEIYVRGYNDYGQLGLGDYTRQHIHLHQKLILHDVDHKQIKSISCGGYHTIVLMQNSEMYVWGFNNCGQLGLGCRQNISFPHRLMLPDNSQIISVSCGFMHTIALTKQPTGSIFSRVYVWGRNASGQLGLGDNNNYHGVPQKLVLFFTVVSIECGEDYTVALTNIGDVYTWGHNAEGQCGSNNEYGYNSPHKVMLSEPIKSIWCGSYHMIVQAKSNKLYVWGFNNSGQLGLGYTNQRCCPTELKLPNVKSIACGKYHTIALTDNNQIYSWGDNSSEQLGCTDCANYNSPHKLDF